jgi:hypothetical protein
MSDTTAATAESLWTVDFPKSRSTQWHQTYKELIVHVGQALGLSMAFGHQKQLDVKVEVEISPGNVRVWVRSTEEDVLVLEGHRETAPH